MRALFCKMALIGLLLVSVAVQARAAQPIAKAQEHAPAARMLDAAGATPADVDLVLMIDGATGLRRTELATAIGVLFEPAGPLADSRVAWNALAAELGWNEEQAFDLLLGRRVTLVARGIENAEQAQWVLMSEVSVETDRRLKDRLKASPRWIAKGQQVLSIEQGRYELTSHRRADKNRRKDADARDITVLLAPTGRTELLDSVLGELVSGNQPFRKLRDEPAFAQAKKLGEPEIFLMARLGPREADAPVGGARVAWPDFLIVSARREPGEEGASRWAASVVLRERSRQQQLLAAAMSSDAAFNELSPRSLLTIVQMAPLSTVFGRVLPFDDPLKALPWPERATDLFTGKQAIWVNETLSAGPDAKPGIACTLAMETSDTAKLADVLDPEIGVFFTAVRRAANREGESTPSFPDFAGFAPQAARVLTLEMGGVAPIADVAGSGLATAWAYPSVQDGTGGWWTLAISALGDGPSRVAAAVRAAGAALVQRGEQPNLRPCEQKRWIWLMASRPRDLEAVLSAGLPDFRGVRSLMRCVSEASCRLSITDEGDVQGEVMLRLFAGEGR